MAVRSGMHRMATSRTVLRAVLTDSAPAVHDLSSLSTSASEALQTCEAPWAGIW